MQVYRCVGMQVCKCALKSESEGCHFLTKHSFGHFVNNPASNPKTYFTKLAQSGLLFDNVA